MSNLLDCGHFPSVDANPGTGSASYFDGDGVERTCCYVCATERERADMLYRGRATLHLNLRDTGYGEVTNWCGKLRFDIAQARKGKHNFAKVRYDVWFHDENGDTWWGVTYGDDTDVCHCTRLKNTA